MKVCCKMNYRDTRLKRDVKVGEQLEVTEARAKVLIEAGVADPVTPMENEAPKGKSKK